VWADVWEERIASIFRVEPVGSSLADFSTLKMDVIRFSKTSVRARSERRHIPEDGILHSHRRENLKSYKPEFKEYNIINLLRFSRSIVFSCKFDNCVDKSAPLFPISNHMNFVPTLINYIWIIILAIIIVLSPLVLFFKTYSPFPHAVWSPLPSSLLGRNISQRPILKHVQSLYMLSPYKTVGKIIILVYFILLLETGNWNTNQSELRSRHSPNFVCSQFILMQFWFLIVVPQYFHFPIFCAFMSFTML
jgi:hypothetical protein